MNVTLELNHEGTSVPMVFKVTDDNYVNVTFNGEEYYIDRDELIRLGKACLPLVYTSPVQTPGSFVNEERKYYR